MRVSLVNAIDEPSLNAGTDQESSSGDCQGCERPRGSESLALPYLSVQATEINV